jgi:sulfur-oxidizing protein SoxX
MAWECHNQSTMSHSLVLFAFWRPAYKWGLCAVMAVSSVWASPKDEGWRIMTDKSLGNCWACHALPGQQGLVSNFAPSLAGAGARWSVQQLTQWVVDARQMNPQTLMPPFGVSSGLQRVSTSQPLLTPEQIQQVVNTLASWR